jgi:hypothetical protein
LGFAIHYEEKGVRNPRELTRQEILTTAVRFRWFRKMPKWTVIVDNRELPARPLVLEAAGVPPNDPTNSHQAIAILENLGFETRYAGQPGPALPAGESVALERPPTDLASLTEMFSKIAEGIPEDAWDGLPTDLSKNVDHYLYGTKRHEE